MSSTVPKRCVVTGGSGLVGQRLVEMLVERGSEYVVSFDIAPAPKDASTDSRIRYVQGDITKPEDVLAACEGVECVFHVAALVGPYYPPEAHERVNYHGTLHVIDACKKLGIRKLVMSSSPSTRFPYPDPNIRGLTEAQLAEVNKGEFAPRFLQTYAEFKAKGEQAMREACGPELLAVAVAPHQVYGPRDALFFPSLLGAAAEGKLRVFGDGENLISVTYVDNYCHGMILGAEALYPGSPVLGKFYVVTDGPPVKLWRFVDEAVVAMGFPSLFTKAFLPTGLMLVVGWLSENLGRVISITTGTPYHLVMKRLRFNVFAVKMLTIHRYFNIEAAKRDLHYSPVVPLEQALPITLAWLKEHWLPTVPKPNPKSNPIWVLGVVLLGISLSAMLYLFLRS